MVMLERSRRENVGEVKGLRFAVRGRGAKFGGLSLRERLLSLEIVFHIFNPNDFPVVVERAKYRIYFREGDTKIGEGSIDEDIYIPSHMAEYAKSEVKTPLSGDLAKTMIHQMEHGKTTLDFEGIAHIVTPEGPMDITFKAVWKLG
jgi:LEA14-like dessication related protein